MKVLYRRWKTPFAELDVVLQGASSNHLLVLEVKRNVHVEFRTWILSARQKNRLQRAVLWLSERGFAVDFRFVIVDKNGSLEIISDVFC